MGVVKLFGAGNRLLDVAPYLGGNRVTFAAAKCRWRVERAVFVHCRGVTRVVWGRGSDANDAPKIVKPGGRFELQWADANIAVLQERIGLSNSDSSPSLHRGGLQCTS